MALGQIMMRFHEFRDSFWVSQNFWYSERAVRIQTLPVAGEKKIAICTFLRSDLKLHFSSNSFHFSRRLKWCLHHIILHVRRKETRSEMKKLHFRPFRSSSPFERLRYFRSHRFPQLMSEFEETGNHFISIPSSL